MWGYGVYFASSSFLSFLAKRCYAFVLPEDWTSANDCYLWGRVHDVWTFSTRDNFGLWFRKTILIFLFDKSKQQVHSSFLLILRKLFRSKSKMMIVKKNPETHSCLFNRLTWASSVYNYCNICSKIWRRPTTT